MEGQFTFSKMQLDLHSIPICCGKYKTGETALEAHSEEVASEARRKGRDGAILANPSTATVLQAKRTASGKALRQE